MTDEGSNGSWGEAAEGGDELAQLWDSFSLLDDSDPAINSFIEAKHLTHGALIRAGAKASAPATLAYTAGSAIKFRNVLDGRRWSAPGSEFTSMHRIPATDNTGLAIIAEGETDGARLSMLYPQCDVFILPLGATGWKPQFKDQLTVYTGIYVATDADEAGGKGAAKIMAELPGSARLLPPDGCVDWCDYEGSEPPELPKTKLQLSLIVFGKELRELEVPDVTSWYENAILPVGGLMFIHGWTKSFKSYIALDLLSSIAQGTEWCGFKAMEEPSKVAVIQYEIQWPYYRERTEYLYKHAANPTLWDENFGTYSPMARPSLRAGDKRSEDELLNTLTSNHIQVMLIDPIRRATGPDVDINSEADSRKLLGFFERVQDQGITVVAVHHDNKAGSKSSHGDPASMTGSGAWAGDPDTIVSVTKPRGVSIQEPKRNLNFTLRNAPSIDARGYQLLEDGRSDYSLASFDTSAEGTATQDNAYILPTI